MLVNSSRLQIELLYIETITDTKYKIEKKEEFYQTTIVFKTLL